MSVTLGVLQRYGRQALHRAGIPSPGLDSDLLLCAATGTTRERILGYPETPVAPHQESRFQSYIERRKCFEPVSRILGAREFWGLPFAINEDVLDPRPDSETLVRVALDLLSGVDRPSILDLGTGSGCLLLALLHERSDATGVGLDLSQPALHVAHQNAARLGSAERAVFVQGDWPVGLGVAPFDIVISNPPYIPSEDISDLTLDVKHFDPLFALDGGPDGFAAYRAIAPLLPALLRPRGLVVFEVGIDQAGIVAELLEAVGAADIHIHQDLSQRQRCVSASFPETREKQQK